MSNKNRAEELKNHAERLEQIMDEIDSIREEAEDQGYFDINLDEIEAFKGWLQEKSYNLEPKYEIFAVATPEHDIYEFSNYTSGYMERVGTEGFTDYDDALEVLKTYRHNGANPFWLYGIREIGRWS